MLIFDHVGVVVRDVAQGRARLAALLDIVEWSDEFDDPVNGVTVQFGRDPAGVCYELIAPLGPDSPVAGALASGRAVLNHMAYRTADLAAAAARLREAGAMPTSGPKPAIAYGGRPVQFFVTPLRFIIELIEAPDHAHLFTSGAQD